MTGKSHFSIGVSTAIALGLYAILTGQFELLTACVVTPFGAMLPDIDHNQSKLGRTRKRVVGIMTILFRIALIPIILYLIFSGTIANLYRMTGTRMVMIPGVVVALIVFLRSPAVQGRIHWMTKHRGIMHTLIPPLLLYLGYKSIGIIGLNYIFLGLAVGYCSHLVADCLTKDGCPLLFPASTSSISFSSVRTGTKGESVEACLLMGGIICLGVFMAMRG